MRWTTRWLRGLAFLLVSGVCGITHAQDVAGSPADPGLAAAGPTAATREPLGPNGEINVPFESASGQVLAIYIYRKQSVSIVRRFTRSVEIRFRSECTSPCQLRMIPGRYRLGLALGDRPPVWGTGSLAIQPGRRLVGELVTHRAARRGSIVAGMLGVLGGMVLIAAAHDSTTRFVLGSAITTEGWVRPRLIGGLVLASVGLGVTIGVGRGLRDRAVLHLMPL